MPKHTRYPGIEAMSDGRKRIRARTVDPRTGRMKEVDRIIKTSMEEAIVLQQRWRQEIRTADQKAVAVPRLSDYATSWMKSRALAVKPSTARTYAEILDVHVVPALGDFFLDKITDKDVREWQAALAGKKAAATVNNAIRLLKMVLMDGCAEFNLSRSGAARVRSLPMRRASDEDPNILSPNELGRVLDAFRATESEDYALALTLALTGLRFGEATALKWSDVREVDGLIRVARAQWKGQVSTTKTGVVRSVPLVPVLSAALRAHRARLVASQHVGLAEGWCFPGPDGGLLPKNYLRRPLMRALKQAKIERRFTIHGFRRTFNNLARQVAGEIVTRSITGHVTQAMTEHYSHVGREEKLAAAGNIVRLVLGGGGDPSSGGSSGGSTTSADQPATPARLTP